MTRTIALSACICFALLVSCKKYDLKYRGIDSRCRIEKMTGEIFGGTVNRVFTYNDQGNPVAIEYVETQGGTGTPNIAFTYDANNQLIAFTGYSDHRLFYNDAGLIVIDSIQSGYVGGDFRSEHRYSYDVLGRITRVIQKFYYDRDNPDFIPSADTTYYRYNQKGNLIQNGVTYDNKTSAYRTHPIWMFMNRNYSLNNPVQATAYNTAKLPTKVANDYPFFESSIYVSDITYSCPTEAK